MMNQKLNMVTKEDHNVINFETRLYSIFLVPVMYHVIFSF